MTENPHFVAALVGSRRKNQLEVRRAPGGVNPITLMFHWAELVTWAYLTLRGQEGYAESGGGRTLKHVTTLRKTTYYVIHSFLNTVSKMLTTYQAVGQPLGLWHYQGSRSCTIQGALFTLYPVGIAPPGDAQCRSPAFIFLVYDMFCHGYLSSTLERKLSEQRLYGLLTAVSLEITPVPSGLSQCC